MALLEIVNYPNRVLEQPGEPVTEFGDGLKKLDSQLDAQVKQAGGGNGGGGVP